MCRVDCARMRFSIEILSRDSKISASLGHDNVMAWAMFNLGGSVPCSSLYVTCWMNMKFSCMWFMCLKTIRILQLIYVYIVLFLFQVVCRTFLAVRVDCFQFVSQPVFFPTVDLMHHYLRFAVYRFDIVVWAVHGDLWTEVFSCYVSGQYHPDFSSCEVIIPLASVLLLTWSIFTENCTSIFNLRRVYMLFFHFRSWISAIPTFW